MGGGKNPPLCLCASVRKTPPSAPFAPLREKFPPLCLCAKIPLICYTQVLTLHYVIALAIIILTTDGHNRAAVTDRSIYRPINTDKHKGFENYSDESVSICVLYLCVCPRSGYGPVDFIDLWFSYPFFLPE